MSYNFRLGLRPAWVLKLDDGNGEEVSLESLVALLSAVDATGNIAGACQACRLSYRHAWGVLRRFEALFGVPLLVTHRRRGSELSEFARRLLWANRRIDARLMPMLESTASELQEELERLTPQAQPSLRMHASHGFAVEFLVGHMADKSPTIDLRYRTSLEALISLRRGECELAGFEVPLGEYEKPFLNYYAEGLDRDEHLLIHVAVRHTGLFLAPGNPRAIYGMSDLTRPDVRFVNWQTGSSPRYLISKMLEREQISAEQVRGYDSSEFTQMAIAAHIASSMADAGLGVETAAWRFGLDFLPLVRERYLLALHKRNLELPAMRELLQVMRGKRFRSYVGQLVGYDGTATGALQTVEQVFGPEN